MLVKKNHFRSIWLTAILSGLSLLSTNAQSTEKLIKKLPDGREIYQRTQESISNRDSQDPSAQKQELVLLKVEAVLRNTEAKQEEILWFKEISFVGKERAVNFLRISDVYVKNSTFYLLYYDFPELRVAKLAKTSNGWSSKDDTYLESTSESVNPITESKFVGKKPKIIAKRSFGDIYFTIYEWKLKKNKWVLIREKKVQPKLAI